MIELQNVPKPPLNVYGLEQDLWSLSNKASDLFMADHPYEALGLIKQAVGIRRCVPTLVNTAVILTHIGRFSEAFPYAKEAYELAPDDENAVFLYAEALLRFGKYEEGWPLFLKSRANMDWLKFWLPEWQPQLGQSLRDRRIVCIEREGSGIGDNLYFFRNLLVLRSLGAKITVICRPSFVPLVEAQGFPTITNFGGHANVNWTHYDYYCPILSLGAKLGLTWRGPYIKRKKHWRWGKPKVGLCWKAGEQISQKTTRFLTKQQVEGIVEALPRKYTWVNLTYGEEPVGRMQHGRMGDWLETSNTIAQCDLVVSVDTGVAHLGGSMGRPTWVVLPGASAWLYPVGYVVHPFYPTMRLFRNPYDGMEEAVHDLIIALEEL